jgi:hypothetical protein
MADRARPRALGLALYRGVPGARSQTRSRVGSADDALGPARDTGGQRLRTLEPRCARRRSRPPAEKRRGCEERSGLITRIPAAARAAPQAPCMSRTLSVHFAGGPAVPRRSVPTRRDFDR